MNSIATASGRAFAQTIPGDAAQPPRVHEMVNDINARLVILQDQLDRLQERINAPGPKSDKVQLDKVAVPHDLVTTLTAIRNRLLTVEQTVAQITGDI